MVDTKEEVLTLLTFEYIPYKGGKLDSTGARTWKVRNWDDLQELLEPYRGTEGLVTLKETKWGKP